MRESLALFIKHPVICGWWMYGSFHVTAGTGYQVNPNTGVGILFVDLPFWSVVTFDETHRKSLNLEPNDRQSWVWLYSVALGQAMERQYLERKGS